MATKIEERFVVKAPIGTVWTFLIEPRQVVTCLPGAALVEVLDDRTFLGNVKVKVGPIHVAYRGRVRLADVDEASHRVRMTGEGRESGGAGSARMALESTLEALPDGSTAVLVRADVDVAGRLVQLGRGMIEQVSHQIFDQFSRSVRNTLEARDAPATGPAAPPAATAASGGSASSVPSPVPVEPGAISPAPHVEPLRALPLVWRALVAMVVTWFRRLRGSHRRDDRNAASPHHPGQS